MDVFTQLWLIWIALFGVIEGAALLSNKEGRTLTARIVSWASLKDKSGGWLARRGTLAGFAGWLLYHFFSKVEW